MALDTHSAGTGLLPSVPGVVDSEENKATLLNMLEEARHDWDRREWFRRQRRKARNYYRGLQWEQLVPDPDEEKKGEYITERELIQRQKRVPWVMNHVSAIVRNLKGQFRQNRSERAAFAVRRSDNPEAVEQVNLALRAARRYNQMRIIEPDQFEEHILSGASGFYISIEWDPKLRRNEVSVEQIDQARLFFNLDVRDRRLKGLRRIGLLHDLTWEDLVATYATDEQGRYDPGVAEELESYYSDAKGFNLDIFARYGFGKVDSLDFYNTWDTNYNRVVELWRREIQRRQYLHDRQTGEYGRGQMTDAEIGEENYQREIAGMAPVEAHTYAEPVWMQYHITPYGDLLYKSESPYWHGSHPFVLGLATLLDGETWGLIENVIDPQRWLNRITSMLDFSLSSSAKGVLMIAEESIPDDMTLAEFADEWNVANGVVKFKAKKGVPLPQQIAGNAIPAGSFEMLGSLKQWIEEVSGVTGPMQGFKPSSDTPASLYQQQILQAATTNLDYFESYLEMLQGADRKLVQCLIQAYDEPRTVADAQSQVIAEYSPEDVRNMDWDVAMGDVADTATFRQLWEQDLQQYLMNGFIDFGTFLEMSSHPKAQQLLKLLERRGGQELLQTPAPEVSAAGQMRAGGTPGTGQSNVLT